MLPIQLSFDSILDHFETQHPSQVLGTRQRAHLSRILQLLALHTPHKSVEELFSTYSLLPVLAQRYAISSIVEHLTGLRPKALQEEALHHLFPRVQAQQPQDLILIVRTSYSKSLIMQALPLFRPSGVVLMIVPLDRIGKEQEAKINSIRQVKSRAIFLNSSSIREQGLLRRVVTGEFTHILLSPELAVGEFHKPSTDPEFKQRIIAILIDELHLVSQWGKQFRPCFAQLQCLRQRIGYGVPMFGCSATLDETLRQQALDWAGFRQPYIIQGSIDRASVKLIVHEIPLRQKKTFGALFFLLSNAVDEHNTLDIKLIPKTLIVIDLKKQVRVCVDTLRSWLYRWAKVPH